MTMTRAAGVSAVALTAALLAPLSLTTAQVGRAAVQTPDVVILVIDDADIEMLRQMPLMRSLVVAPGVTFADAMVPTSLCCPSRTSILTGNFSHTTGVWTNEAPLGGFPAFDDRSTLATWLHAGGYRTGLFGKYLNGYEQGYVPPGWDAWVGNGADAYYDFRYTTVDGEIHRSAPEEYGSYFFADRASRFIRLASPTRPLFAYVALPGVHDPAIPAPEDVGAGSALEPWSPPNLLEPDVSDKPPYVQALPTDRPKIERIHQRRYETLLSTDRAFGRVIDALADTGRLQRTLVVLMSDNGFLLGEHRILGKRVPYDRSTRIPMAIRYDPGGWTGARSGIVANIDIAPTIGALTRIAFPPMDGRDLSSMAAGGDRVRSHLPLESVAFGRTGMPAFCGLRTIRAVFVHYADGFEELYRYPDDPWELRNVARAPRNARLLERMRAKAVASCDPVPPGFAW